MSVPALQKIIDESNNIVFFGGAGVSTESGIPDFRSKAGLYNQKCLYPPEVILSHSYFVKRPADFFEFYRDKMLFDNINPNAAHFKLAEWEKAGKLKAVITQNIDGLHQKAGSINVLELHGSVYRNYCQSCGRPYDINYIRNSKGIPLCACSGIIRPDVVLYEEGLDSKKMRAAAQYISDAEVLIVGGTSLLVYPAAGLVDFFQGDQLILINRTSTPFDRRADLIINESIAKTLARIY